MNTPATRDVLDYLEKDLMKVIKKDMPKILKAHEKQDSGHFSMPRELFCYIDHLGDLRAGPQKRKKELQSKNAIAFIEKYMKQADKRYKKYGELLYTMWRHGTVHEFRPKVYKDVTGKYTIGWSTNNSSAFHNRICHLNIYCKRKNHHILVFHVNIFELFDHFLISFDSFISELKSNNKLKKIVQDRFNQISNPTNKNSLNDQINLAIQDIAGEVDEKGSIVALYKKKE